MSLIEGFATHAAGAELLPYKYDPGELKASEVEIAISHCGICRSDLHMVDNDWGISQYPLIPGHEIIGKITSTGSAVLGLNAGDRVGVGWQANSCGLCEWCLQGAEHLCPDSQGTCVNRNGGCADRIRVNARFVFLMPDGLESERAAPLLCGGISVYSPLRQHAIHPASRVGIVGIGGLGHIAVQFARAFGAEVTAFSTSPAKELDARTLGADNFVNSRETKNLKKLAGHFDLILSTVEADQDWNAYLGALRPRGVFCFVGVPPGVLGQPVLPLVAGQKVVTGSSSGSPLLIREMLRVAERHKVQAITERFAMSKANEAVNKLKKNRVRYRAVLAN